MNAFTFTTVDSHTSFDIACGFVIGYAVTTLCMAVLTTFLWWFVAALLSVLASLAVGYITYPHVHTRGYDLTVSAVASVRGFFAKRNQVAA